MTDHKLEISEGAEVADAAKPPRMMNKYRVTAKVVREVTKESAGCEGLFKNGVLYKPGDILELSEDSARGYIELGEIELVEEAE